MTDVLLFHHAQGLTDGMQALADELRAAGHRVVLPDLYEGARFATLDEGVAHAERVGFDAILERGRAAAEGMPPATVYTGFSLGVLPAQLLAQGRPGALGAVLVSACVPAAEFGGPWPAGVPAQVHLMADDPLVVDADLPAARELAAQADGVELFCYPGDRHLFADTSLPDFDAPAAAALRERMHAFLDRVG